MGNIAASASTITQYARPVASVVGNVLRQVNTVRPTSGADAREPDTRMQPKFLQIQDLRMGFQKRGVRVAFGTAVALYSNERSKGVKCCP